MATVEVLSAPGRSRTNTHQGWQGRGSKSGWRTVSVSEITFACGKGAHLMPPNAHQPRVNSPTGVSSLISRYVSKKWLMKKGSRFTWPASQRARASVTCPSASFTHSPRGRRGAGLQWALRLSTAMAAFLRAKGPSESHQLRVAIEPWSTGSCAEV